MNRILALCALAVALAPGAAAADPAADVQAVLDAFEADNPGTPGVVVHVECPRLGLNRSFTAGNDDFDSGEPLTARHTFRIASNTKTYVAVAVLRLAEQGKLDLDDSFGAHLPARYRDMLRGDRYDLEAITIRQVLSHTGGLFEHSGDPRYAEMVFADPQHAWTRDEQIGYMVEWGDPVGEPGEKFSYSDSGYILLGAIIEQLTGKTLAAAVHELCDYEKLDLKSTWWEIYEEKPAGAGPRAHQYIDGKDSFAWHPGMDLYGGGGLITDARDLGHFLRLLMKGRVLVEEATLQEMIAGGTPGYRLGLSVTELGDHVAYGHTGFWNSFAYHVPALDLTVAGAILSRDAARGHELADELVSKLEDAAD